MFAVLKETRAERQIPAQKNRKKETRPEIEILPRTAQSDSGKIVWIELGRICPNPAQPRTDFEDDKLFALSDSIRRHGILQPLCVRELSSQSEPFGGLYEMIAGERRLRACKLLGLERVPCIVLGVDRRRSAELALIENMQREDLNFFEQACAMGAMMDLYGVTQQELARRLSVSQSFVANKMRLLRLTQSERTAILDAGLTERHARALIRIDSFEKRQKLLQKIIEGQKNVSQTEEMVEAALHKTPARDVPHRTFIPKDIRLFINTVDRAISTIKSSGIAVESQKNERDGEIELVIRIPKCS